MSKSNIQYKDSGIAWIGQIPEDFKVSKLKYVFKYITGATPDSGKSGYYGGNNNWITISDLDGKYTGESKNKITNFAVKEKKMKIVPKGSLLYSFKLSVGQLAFVVEDTYTNEAIFAILEKEGLNLDFWYYALGSYFINNANENIYGAKIFNQYYINNGLLIVPDKDTQTTIANYLDIKTTQISEFIAKKKQLISLLQEQKQAIIHQAVTKGIDPSTKMKNSGIPWIGQIPEGWEVRRLKTVCDAIQTGGTPKDPDKNPVFANGNIPRYGPSDFNNSLILPEITTKMLNSEKLIDGDMNIYPPSTVFIIGIGATVGKIGLSKVTSSSNQQLNAIIFGKKVYPEFGLYFLTAIQVIIKNLSNSATLPILNQTQTKNLFFFLPPSIEEQQQIVSYIEFHTSKIDQAIAKIEQEISIIEEYRTSLIYHAVTGKINVE